MITFQEIINRLNRYWEKQGCLIQQGYDMEVGAGTFNPATFLRALGSEPYKSAYIEPSRRPSDGRYGTNPNRLQHFFQYQVVLKPSPLNMQELYLDSLKAIGFDISEHDIRFVHDDWESPTLGAWGLGWEVWMDGMEVTQYTYFQSVGGQMLKPITGELTYGVERLTMYLQKVNSIYDIKWNDELTYGDIYQRNEKEFSHYNFEEANVEMWFRHFDDFEREAQVLLEKELPLPAYDFVMKASHAFNMLDARGVISVTERTGYITRIRNLACKVAAGYLISREKQNYPLLNKFQSEEKIVSNPVPPLAIELLTAKEGVYEDFVLEIGSEELPATFVTIGCQNLEKLFKDFLKEEKIPFESLIVYGTPRRLSVYIKNLALIKPGKTEERRGPNLTTAFDKEGKVSQAGAGFFRSIQKEAPSLAEIREGRHPELNVKTVNGEEYLFATISTPSSPTAPILAKKLPEIILKLDFPKKMHWSNLDIAYARPLRWFVSLLGEHIIPFSLANIVSGRTSFGHSQLNPGKFEIKKAEDYEENLIKHFISVDGTRRKEAINRQLDEIESNLKAKVVERERVIQEVVNLVEWPQCITTTFDSKYLAAPKEVLISEMIHHQRYFPLENLEGSLLNTFIVTSDTNPTEYIKEGNVRALSPRLADGVSLYEIDRSVSLEQFNDKLKNVTFQKELGTVFEKVLRLTSHVKILQKMLNISSPENVERAALFSKSDLVSKMVFEFPELQGVMGRYYANHHGEHQEVSQAIEEHWMPRSEKAPLPSSDTGIILSLADKIDNLIGCFAVGLKPTSSSDPYALRRQTLGIIRILIQNKLSLPLESILTNCLNNFQKEITKRNPNILKEIKEFIINRIKTVFIDYGVKKDEIEATVSSGIDDIYDAYCKVISLHEFRKSNDKFLPLYEVYKRAKGQITNQNTNEFSESLLKEEAEICLHNNLKETQSSFNKAICSNNYSLAYTILAETQPSLAKLFDEVKILADEESVRKNRLALLNQVFERFSSLLDFDKIQEMNLD